MIGGVRICPTPFLTGAVFPGDCKIDIGGPEAGISMTPNGSITAAP
tara:strand:- start:348 stop:485 length:138 start_codon:yes stop_codon:yes gene_type:complete